MNTEALPKMNVFMYTDIYHLQVTASLIFDFSKLGEDRSTSTTWISSYDMILVEDNGS
jgi:hypothetical protein